jgi:hypothetical protein
MPMLKLTAPRLFPVISPPPRPFTAMSVDPVKVRPLLVPERVPPLLVKSTLVPAKAANGRARTRTPRKIIFLIIKLVSPGKFTRPWESGS